MFWIQIVLPGAQLRYQALRVDCEPCTRLHGDEGVDERQTRGGDGGALRSTARSWRVLTNVRREWAAARKGTRRRGGASDV